MKNIMVLGANYLQLPLIKRILELGHNVIVVSPNLEEVGHLIATHSIKADVRDSEKILSEALSYKIDGILTDQTDIPVRTAAYIAEKLNLPGIGYNTACIFTDKAKMRTVCCENNIYTMPYIIAKDVNQAINFFREYNCEMILKPADNQASKGIFRINSEEDIIDKFQSTMNFSAEKKVLLEKFIEGSEMEIDTLVLNNKIEVDMIGDVTPFIDKNIFAASKRSYPSTKSNEITNRLRQLNSKIIKLFNLKNGITHGEYIIDKDGNIYLLEIAARGGGSYISSHIWYIQTGIHVEDIIIKLALGEEIELKKTNGDKNVTCYISSFLPAGRVIDITGINELDHLDYIVIHSFNNIKLDMKISDSRDKTARFTVVIYASNHSALENNIINVKELLKIKVDTGVGIKGPIWE